MGNIVNTHYSKDGGHCERKKEQITNENEPHNCNHEPVVVQPQLPGSIIE